MEAVIPEEVWQPEEGSTGRGSASWRRAGGGARQDVVQAEFTESTPAQHPAQQAQQAPPAAAAGPQTSAGRVPEDIGGGEGATVGGKREGGPRAFLGGEADVDLLDLPAGHVLFEMQVEAEEREDDGDWFLLRVRALQRDRVDRVLVDERRVAVRERVGEELGLGGGVIHGRQCSRLAVREGSKRQTVNRKPWTADGKLISRLPFANRASRPSNNKLR